VSAHGDATATLDEVAAAVVQAHRKQWRAWGGSRTIDRFAIDAIAIAFETRFETARDAVKEAEASASDAEERAAEADAHRDGKCVGVDGGCRLCERAVDAADAAVSL
jgi:hypothetical protein